MKKAINILFILFIFSIFFTGCTKKDYSFKEKVEKDSIIYKLDIKLRENNITYSKIKVTDNVQNSKECYYYYFEKNNPVVIYLFDEGSSEYQKIANQGGIYEPNSPDPVKVDAYKGLVIKKNSSLISYDEILRVIKSL